MGEEKDLPPDDAIRVAGPEDKREAVEPKWASQNP
jgi:hypothetical protein